eukprot:scaffold1981_cov345-Pinguiococcus_pyrenoidosus.AAC.7
MAHRHPVSIGREESALQAALKEGQGVACPGRSHRKEDQSVASSSVIPIMHWRHGLASRLGVTYRCILIEVPPVSRKRAAERTMNRAPAASSRLESAILRLSYMSDTMGNRCHPDACHLPEPAICRWSSSRACHFAWKMQLYTTQIGRIMMPVSFPRRARREHSATPIIAQSGRCPALLRWPRDGERCRGRLVRTFWFSLREQQEPRKRKDRGQQLCAACEIRHGLHMDWMRCEEHRRQEGQMLLQLKCTPKREEGQDRRGSVQQDVHGMVGNQAIACKESPEELAIGEEGQRGQRSVALVRPDLPRQLRSWKTDKARRQQRAPSQRAASQPRQTKGRCVPLSLTPKVASEGLIPRHGPQDHRVPANGHLVVEGVGAEERVRVQEQAGANHHRAGSKSVPGLAHCTGPTRSMGLGVVSTGCHKALSVSSFRAAATGGGAGSLISPLHMPGRWRRQLGLSLDGRSQPRGGLVQAALQLQQRRPLGYRLGEESPDQRRLCIRSQGRGLLDGTLLRHVAQPSRHQQLSAMGRHVRPLRCSGGGGKGTEPPCN